MSAMSREEFEAFADEWQQSGGWQVPAHVVTDLIDTVKHWRANHADQVRRKRVAQDLHAAAIRAAESDDLLTTSGPSRMEMIAELRRAVGLFDGAMPITPEQAWTEAVGRARQLHEERVESGWKAHPESMGR